MLGPAFVRFRAALLALAVAAGCYDPDVASPDGAAAPQAGDDPPVAEDAAVPSCPDPYQRASTGCYRINLTLTPWLQAAADCEDDLPGATHLVVFEAYQEHDVVEGLGGTGWDFWIGLVHDGTRWRWVTGGEPTFSRWESDGMDGWTCGRIVNGEWDDEECPKPLGYACEHDGRPAVLRPAP